MGKQLHFLLTFLFLLGSMVLLAQEIDAPLANPPVVISSYCNATDPRDEWSELLVVADNVNMNNWTFGDNNSSQNSFQPTITFNNPIWSNLRAGTIIIIWHRTANLIGPVHNFDYDKSDGYIEVSKENGTYFIGPGVAQTTTLDIAQAGDLLQLKDATGTHVHALGHKNQNPPNPGPGPDFNTLPAQWKLNHAVPSTLNSGEATAVSPGTLLARYGNLAPQYGTTWTVTETAATLTFGLPNAPNPNQAGSNSDFWRSLRQPGWSAGPNLTGTVDVATSNIVLNWTAADDPNAADGTEGYLILRNTVNTFGVPKDGYTYVQGDAITGGGTVLKVIPSSQTITYTDNTTTPFPCADGFYYEIFAYRFGTDNPHGNDYNLARGRAYNETVFGTAHVTFPPPVDPLTASSNPLIICSGSPPATITLSSTGGSGTTLTWYNGGCGTGASIGTGPSITITPPASTTTYYVRWETPCGQSGCASVTVTVNTPVNTTFASIGPLCQNSTPPLLPPSSTNTPPVTGTWNPPAINTTLIGTTTYTFTPAASECATTVTMQVTITAPIVPTFTPIGQLCINSTPPPLPGSSNNTPPIPGTWNPPVINTAAVGTTVYTFTPNTGECATTATMSIEIVAEITPTFNQIGPLCVGSLPPPLPSGSTNTPAITGIWSPPTISTATAGTTTYTFTPNPGQCAGTATMDITVDNQITPTFNPIGPLCMGSTPPSLPPNSTNVPPITGTWSPASINTSAVGTSTYTFTPGAGQCGVSTTMSVTITTQITPVFTQIGPLCLNSAPPALPPSSLNTPPITGTWSPVTISTSSSGNFNYTFTPDPGQCAKDTILQITIDNQITPTFDPIGPLCLNSTPPQLPPASLNDIPGAWVPPVISTSTAGTTTYTFMPGAGQCGIPVNMDILVTTEITPTFDPVGPLCQNSTPPVLPPASINGITGTWSPATINTSTPGSFTFAFTPTGPGQCALPASLIIGVEPLLTSSITVSVDPPSACEGTEITFTGDTLNAGSSPQFEWLVDGVSMQTGPSRIYQSSSLANGQSVVCRMTSSCPCLAGNPVNSTPVSVTVSPVPHVTLSNQSTLCAGTSSQLDAGSGFISYLWQNGTSGRYLTATDVGLYWVQVTDNSGCTGGSDTVTVKVCETGIIVPTAFSPNYDGNNDVFKPVATLDGNSSYTLSIVNRWGETVFESNDVNIGWDGTRNGELLPPGTYVWKIVYKSVSSTGKAETMKGTVMLLR